MIDAVCAGHICLDMTPKFPDRGLTGKDIFVGGKLSNVEGMAFSTGGSASNTGLAMNRLGLNVPIMGRVGSDIIGKITADLLQEQGGTGEYLSVAEGERSSFSTVLAVPGEDRIFLHDPAVNDTFVAEDIDYEVVEQARLFHFGYPPLMQQMYINRGAELLKILKHVKTMDVTTAIDTSYPDPSSEAAQADWNEIFERTLPYTDIFEPSIEEIILMTDRPLYNELKSMDDDILVNLELDMIAGIGKKLLGMGAKIVVLKCGTLGFYVRTADEKTLSRMGKAVPPQLGEWADREIFSGIYTVDDVKSATGAGDSSVAGFLAALLRGYTPEMATSIACGTGAMCVTDYSAVGGIVPLEDIVARIDAGWEKRPVQKSLQRMRYSEEFKLYL